MAATVRQGSHCAETVGHDPVPHASSGAELRDLLEEVVVAVPEEREPRRERVDIEPGALTGTKPKGGRLEWEVLGRRDRAALNENFARELPLEYRAILKDYYERLTK